MEAEDGELVQRAGKTFRRWKLKTSGARGLADLHSIILDLRRVVYRCELMQQTEHSDEIRQALWESIVITYYRSFTAGRSGEGAKDRRRLTEKQLDRLDPTHRETHNRLRRERNRHVAHRDDSIGEVTVVHWVEEISAPEGICSLDIETGCLSEPYVDPSAARSLAEALIAQLQVMATVEEQRVAGRQRRRTT